MSQNHDSYKAAVKILQSAIISSPAQYHDAGDLLESHPYETTILLDHFADRIEADFGGTRQLLEDTRSQLTKISRVIAQGQLNIDGAAKLLTFVTEHSKKFMDDSTVKELLVHLSAAGYNIRNTSRRVRMRTEPKPVYKKQTFVQITKIGQSSILATGVTRFDALPHWKLSTFVDELEQHIATGSDRLAVENSDLILCAVRKFILEMLIESYVTDGVVDRRPFLFPFGEENRLLPWDRLLADKEKFTKRFETELIATGKKVRDLWDEVDKAVKDQPMPYTSHRSFQTVANRIGYKIKQHST